MRQSLKKQSRVTMQDFEQRVAFIQTQFAENELNVELYWKNKDYRTYVSLVPTSAITGEGVPDILMLMIQLMQVRQRHVRRSCFFNVVFWWCCCYCFRRK